MAETMTESMKSIARYISSLFGLYNSSEDIAITVSVIDRMFTYASSDSV
jgi:hypothetical protein